MQSDPACTLGEEAKQDLQFAVQAAGGINRLANDLLDVSRLEEAKLPLDVQSNDLVEMARDVLARLGPLDRARTVVLETKEPVSTRCDRGVIVRVLENLVGNAMKHTPSGGRIDVSVAADAGHVRVTVHDQGPGVPLEARSQIFEKFGTVVARKNEKYHSAGLGLTFCKLAIEAHGGRVGVDAGAPSGSVFWFELPS